MISAGLAHWSRRKVVEEVRPSVNWEADTVWRRSRMQRTELRVSMADVLKVRWESS
jgi:hypothetical protein